MKLSNDGTKRVREAFQSADLGDPRRKRRLDRIVTRLAKKPSASLPDAMVDEADLEGLYRFVNNDAVDAQELVSAYARKTAERARKAGRVIVIHDTTTCMPPRGAAEDVGYLSTGKAGFFAHVSLVLDGATWKRPLGVVNLETISRKEPSKRARRSKASGAETAKWKDRESDRWHRGVENSSEILGGCKEVVHVADREADSYALLASMVAKGRSFVVRVEPARMVADSVDPEAERVQLQEHLGDAAGVLERTIKLTPRKASTAPRENKAHPPRGAREATLVFASKKAVLRRPRYLRDPIPETLELNVVRVWEPNPPDGLPPVEWLLLTTLSTHSKAKVAEVVDIYRARWTIEEFNKALKTGCAYESREFETLPALLTMLALSLPIACELLWLRSRARSHPDAPVTEVLSPQQVRVLRAMGSRPLPKNPSARDGLLAVAGLGGHLKRNGDPGWEVLHRGWKQLLAYEEGWKAALRAQRKM